MQLRDNVKKKANLLIIGYIITVVLYQVFWLIAPFRAFLFDTRLNKFSSALAVLGLFIFLWDLITERLFLKSKYVYCLIGVLGVLCISSLAFLQYGLTNNLKVIIWQIVQMLVMFPLYLRLTETQSFQLFRRLHTIISVVFIPAVLISIYQFVTYTAYVVMIDGSASRQGFQEGRLFGVFASVYFTSLFLLIMSVASIYFAIRTSNIYLKVIYIIESILFFIYVILSGTRSVQVGFLVGWCCFAFLWLRNKLLQSDKPRKLWRVQSVCVIVAILSVFILKIAYDQTAILLKQIPLTLNNGPKSDIVIDEKMLERPDVRNGDVSNHRFMIWGNYASVTSQKVLTVLVGNTPGNYMRIIKEHYPNVFIVKYISDNFPTLFGKNLIYDTHNSYLSIYASSGVLGVIALGSFFFLCVRRVLKYIWKEKKLSASFFAAGMIIAVIVTSAFFDSDLFFKCTDTSVIFWIMAGFMIKLTLNGKEQDNKLPEEIP